MTKSFLKRAGWAAGVICVTVACSDVPLLPKWSAEYYLPLPSQRLALTTPNGPFPPGVPIPAGTSGAVSFPAQSEDLGNTIGSLLKDKLDTARVIVTLSSSVPLNGTATLFVDTTTTGSSIALSVALQAATPTRTDTLALTSAGLGLLRKATANEKILYVRITGNVTYPGPGTRTITANDSIGVKLALLAQIAVSR